MQNYKLGKVLGIGSFGKVRLAEHILTKQKVAIKILNKEKIKQQKMEEKVKREIRLLKYFRHPHIIRVFDFFDSSSYVYVIMEYVSGGELFEVITRGKRSEAEARRYFQQMISGIEYCHNHQVAHRDLKPENLLLDENQQIKIGDFGLSNLMKDGIFLNTSCGSPNYAAPEVVSGYKYCGSAVDIWSCGVILYALLTCSLPFDDNSVKALFDKIKAGKFNMPFYLSLHTRDIITRMLQPNPLLRITMEEIKAHPWFQNQLPLYLAIQDNTQPLDSSLKMKESLLDKLYSLEMDIPEDREVVKTSILCRERKDFCVVYEILLSISEKEERLMYLKTLGTCNIFEREEIQRLKGVKLKGQELSSSASNASTATALSLLQINIPSNAMLQDIFWHYGINILFDGSPTQFLALILNVLKQLDIEWKINCANFIIRGRNTAKWRKMYDMDMLQHPDINELKNSFLKFQIHIYKLGPQMPKKYVVDIHKITGGNMNFLDFSQQFFEKLGEALVPPTTSEQWEDYTINYKYIKHLIQQITQTNYLMSILMMFFHIQILHSNFILQYNNSVVYVYSYKCQFCIIYIKIKL